MKKQVTFLISGVLFITTALLLVLSSCEEERDPSEPTVNFDIADLACKVHTIDIYDDVGHRTLKFDNNRLLIKFIDVDNSVRSYRYVFKYPDTCKVYDRNVTTGSKGYITYSNHQKLYDDYGVLTNIWRRFQIDTLNSEAEPLEIVISTIDQLKFINSQKGTYDYRFNKDQYVISEEFFKENIADSVSLTRIEYSYY